MERKALSAEQPRIEENEKGVSYVPGAILGLGERQGQMSRVIAVDERPNLALEKDSADQIAEKTKNNPSRCYGPMFDAISKRARLPPSSQASVNRGVTRWSVRRGAFRLLMMTADQALYRAKANGRNRVESAPGAQATQSASRNRAR